MDASDWIALASLVVAVSTAIVAFRVDLRNKAVIKTELFIQLRSSFRDVLLSLPPEYRDPNWRPSTALEHAAAVRYWHHAYDEWYVSCRLNAALMGRLWDGFYRPAILSGLEHPGLRHAFRRMLEEQPELARLWRDFTRAIGLSEGEAP
jgi:hypothetical protein